MKMKYVLAVENLYRNEKEPARAFLINNSISNNDKNNGMLESEAEICSQHIASKSQIHLLQNRINNQESSVDQPDNKFLLLDSLKNNHNSKVDDGNETSKAYDVQNVVNSNHHRRKSVALKFQEPKTCH